MNNNSNKKQKRQTHASVLESLKDLGSGAVNSLKQDVLRPSDFADQLFGRAPRNFSGDISRGESMDMDEVLAGKHEENQKIRAQLMLERTMRADEQTQSQKKAEELRMQLHVLIQEVKSLASTSSELAEEVQIAAMQAPVEPGVYHVVFFEKLIEFIRGFRKKIQNASVWLQATNKRAQKKNYWAKYKKHGSSFLLSADHYLTRNAG